MCLYPKMIKNRKYVKNKKNGGEIPSVTDLRTEYVPVGCGKCIECRKQYSRQWQIRLHEEIKHNTHGKFITLNFSDQSIAKLLTETIKRTNKETGKIETLEIGTLKGYDRDNQIATKAIRHFLENWRKEYGTSLRHWLVTELGHNGTENIHLHGIIWTHESIEEIRRKWTYGFIYPRKTTTRRTWVNGQTVNYLVKYVSKIDQRHKEYKPIVLTSPGIGAQYINERTMDDHKYNGVKTDETYRMPTGHKINLPIYYRNKIWTENEKERLWTQKLDQEIRYVCGEKISIKNGNDELYKNVLQFHRRRNTELGYGQRENENRKEYEEQRREIMVLTRVNRALAGQAVKHRETD